jgi:hypothetical protein
MSTHYATSHLVGLAPARILAHERGFVDGVEEGGSHSLVPWSSTRHNPELSSPRCF